MLPQDDSAFQRIGLTIALIRYMQGFLDRQREGKAIYLINGSAPTCAAPLTVDLRELSIEKTYATDGGPKEESPSNRQGKPVTRRSTGPPPKCHRGT